MLGLASLPCRWSQTSVELDGDLLFSRFYLASLASGGTIGRLGSSATVVATLRGMAAGHTVLGSVYYAFWI